MGTKPEGETESEICQMLIDDYNANKDHHYLMPSNDPIAEMLKKIDENMGTLGKKFFAKKFPPATQAQGYDLNTSQKFIVELIADLIKLPLEQVSMDFVKNHPTNIHRFTVR